MTPLLIASSIIAGAVANGGIELLNPCRLLCHMQHTIDACKIVDTDDKLCRNFYWTDSSKQSTVVDTVAEDEFVRVEFAESVTLLKAGKGGCEKLCQQHHECIDVGSSCKSSGVCLNLFWNRGAPIKRQMSTCYQLSAAGCEDNTPVLCGSERPRERSRTRGTAATKVDAQEEVETRRFAQVTSGIKPPGNYLPLTLLLVPFFSRIGV